MAGWLYGLRTIWITGRWESGLQAITHLGDGQRSMSHPNSVIGPRGDLRCLRARRFADFAKSRLIPDEQQPAGSARISVGGPPARKSRWEAKQRDEMRGRRTENSERNVNKQNKQIARAKSVAGHGTARRHSQTAQTHGPCMASTCPQEENNFHMPRRIGQAESEPWNECRPKEMLISTLLNYVKLILTHVKLIGEMF